MKRAYFSQTRPGIPGGPIGPDGFHPVTNEIVPAIWQQGWNGTDGRPSHIGTGAGQEMFVVAEVSPAQHGLLIADPRVAYLPIENAGGPLDFYINPISAITVGNRTTIRTLCEVRHIIDDGLALVDPIARLIRRIRRTYLVDGEMLRGDGLRDGITALVSSIPLARRQRIRARLLFFGLDFDTVLLTDTLRQAKLKLVSQNPRAFGGVG